ncbi:MAG: protein translocase subunit SecD [Patescibacteria group bacterium]
MKRLLPLISIFIFAGLLLVGLLSSKDDPNGGFDLGLDLAGGTQLVYQADISELDPGDVQGSMSALRAVLEARLNALGSSDIRVTIEEASIFAQNNEESYRINVEIPGVFDAEEAKSLIGAIPTLDFRLEQSGIITGTSTTDRFVPTELTGRYIDNAVVSTNPQTGQHTVSLQFDSTGTKLFADITRENVGRALGIFLDGELISAPVIQTAISNGNAQIYGQFSREEAANLAQNLQFGALPIPIELVSTQSISPTLGHDILEKGIIAGWVALAMIALILIALYRIAGVVASIALAIYILLLLAYFKLTGTDLTAAGIAGIIITIGMAVDANVLIFERIREEMYYSSASLNEAIHIGFARAWPSIRDGNLSSIIVAIILYYLTTSFVKGFALSFGVGILLSMFTAVVITRSLLKAIAIDSEWFKRFFL